MIRIPPPRSPLWFALGAGIGVAATAIFILFYAVIFNLDVSNVNIGGILLLFVGLCQVSALAGFFKLKLLAGLSFLGLFAGITMLLSVVSKGAGGWEGLVGAISMMVIIVGGFAIGIIAELIKFLIIYLRKSKRGK